MSTPQYYEMLILTRLSIVKADYEVIFLFDGVSMVVPTLYKKFGYPPTVILLAEIDISLHVLVCAELSDVRSHQTWQCLLVCEGCQLAP